MQISVPIYVQGGNGPVAAALENLAPWSGPAKAKLLWQTLQVRGNLPVYEDLGLCFKAEGLCLGVCEAVWVLGYA